MNARDWVRLLLDPYFILGALTGSVLATIIIATVLIANGFTPTVGVGS